jgi:hypothetical protein
MLDRLAATTVASTALSGVNVIGAFDELIPLCTINMILCLNSNSLVAIHLSCIVHDRIEGFQENNIS